MKILIFRHGEAVEAGEVGGSDRARVLTEKGSEQIRRAAEGMLALELKPTAIWTSPYPRSSQTAMIAGEVFGLDDGIKELDELEPGADPGIIAALIQDYAPDDAVMIVGHNPDLENFLEYLISSTCSINADLKKGGLAVVEAQRPIHQGCGTLTSLWTAKHLGKMAG